MPLARDVLLSARSAARHLALTIRDDVPGFDAASISPGYGIGEILGTQLAGVGGTPGSGTVVRITVPLEQP